MRITLLITFLIFAIESAFAQGDTLKIMPLGDSITRGSGSSNHNFNGSLFGSAGYRKLLIDSLISLGYTSSYFGGDDFDIVGSESSGSTDVSFDKDHNGVSGRHASHPSLFNLSLLHKINDLLNENPPDVILLHIGTNDLTDGDTVSNLVNEVSRILDSIYYFNPEINVILAKIINRVDPDNLVDSTTAFNIALEEMANLRIQNGNNLYLVDMENGAGLTYEIAPNQQNPPLTGDDMLDALHPNNIGYWKIANVWFKKLKELLTPTLAYPINDSTFAPVDLALKWESALGAHTYTLQVSTDSTFQSIDILDESSIPDTFYNISSLEFNTEYYWRVSAKINTGSSPFSEVRSFTTTPQSVLVSTRIFLEGPYSSGSGLMSTTLNELGYLPERNPYDTLSWQYSGEDSVVQGFFTSNSSIVDWVLLELRNTVDNTQYIARRAALLKNDGSIVDTDGVSPVLFDGVSPGNYYIVINHRNHLAVMSSQPANLNALDADEYDFTNASSNFFGAGSGAKELAAGVWGMIAGDTSSDNFIDLLDFIGPDNQIFLDDYRYADSNLDGFIDLLDFIPPDNNIFLESSVP